MTLGEKILELRRTNAISQDVLAERLDVSVEDLRLKKIDTGQPRRLKAVKAGGVNADKVKVVEDALLSIMLFGGEAGAGIEFPVPEDEVRLDELSMIFENKYAKMSVSEIKKEVDELLRLHKKEEKAAEVAKLTEQLAEVEDDDEKTREILRKIQKLQKT